MDFATRTIHAGQPAEPETGAVVSPIFQTTTYQQFAPGEHRGFDYTRTSNPTRKRLEAVLADLEGARACGRVRIGSGGRARDSAGLSEAGRARSSCPATCTAARSACCTTSSSRSAAW